MGGRIPPSVDDFLMHDLGEQNVGVFMHTKRQEKGEMLVNQLFFSRYHLEMVCKAVLNGIAIE